MIYSEKQYKELEEKLKKLQQENELKNKEVKIFKAAKQTKR